MENNEIDKTTGLWLAILAGNTLAFDELMTLYYMEMFKYGYTLTGDPELVKDCIQNVFLTIWRTRERLKISGQVKFYLLKSLRRDIFHQTKKASQATDYSRAFLSTIDAEEPGAEDAVIQLENRREMAKKVEAIMAGLPKRQQEVIYLRYYMDLKPEDISEMTGIRRQSVYNLLHDALKRFKKNL